MASDNIPGIDGSLLKRLFLLPGMIAQWLMYMLVGHLNYASLRQQTRLARSPVITLLLSIVIWSILLLFLVGEDIDSFFAVIGLE